jgi:hypothetical protein
VERVSKDTPEGKRSLEKPRNRWLDDVEKDMKKLRLEKNS